MTQICRTHLFEKQHLSHMVCNVGLSNLYFSVHSQNLSIIGKLVIFNLSVQHNYTFPHCEASASRPVSRLVFCSAPLQTFANDLEIGVTHTSSSM